MAMMSHVDAAVANITQALAARGMTDNTIIVVTTDNGGQLNGGGGEPVSLSKSYPLLSIIGWLVHGNIQSLC